MDIAALKKEAKSKKTLPARLLELAKTPDPTVQYAVANNPNTPLPALEYLSGHGKWTILKAVAHNKNVSAAILEKLAGHKQPSVVEAVALSPSTPTALLEKLSKHPEVSVRRALLGNYSHHFTAHLYELLSQDTEDMVRMDVAFRVECPSSVLEKLASDPYTYTRVAVAGAYNTPPKVRLLLAKDPEGAVRASTIDRFYDAGKFNNRPIL
jgi:hypothetical protein